MALDEADKKTVGEIAAAAIKESIATLKTELTNAVGTAVGEATTEITKKVAALEEAAKPPVDDKNKDKNKDKGDEPAWFKSYRESQEAALKPVLEFHAMSKSEREKAEAAAAAKVLVTRTLTEKKLGGLLKNEAVIARIVGTNPKDADAVMAAVETERSYAATFGVKPESFGADVSAEGGAPGSGGDKKSPEERKKATSEAIDKAAKAAVEVL